MCDVDDAEGTLDSRRQRAVFRIVCIRWQEGGYLYLERLSSSCQASSNCLDKGGSHSLVTMVAGSGGRVDDGTTKPHFCIRALTWIDSHLQRDVLQVSRSSLPAGI
jgi:hypothetical protein